MKRIDHSTATEANQFTEGNPSGGVPATVVTADWLNNVQEEIIAVIDEAGITLDGEDQTQLLAAIQALSVGLLATANTWQKAQRYTPAALTISSGAVTWDMEANPVAVLTLSEDVTSFTMSNFVAGGTYELTVIQDATGGWSVAWPSAIQWPGKEAVEVTSDAASEDLINFSGKDASGTPVLRGYAAQDFGAVS